MVGRQKDPTIVSDVTIIVIPGPLGWPHMMFIVWHH